MKISTAAVAPGRPETSSESNPKRAAALVAETPALVRRPEASKENSDQHLASVTNGSPLSKTQVQPDSVMVTESAAGVSQVTRAQVSTVPTAPPIRQVFMYRARGTGPLKQSADSDMLKEGLNAINHAFGQSLKWIPIDMSQDSSEADLGVSAEGGSPDKEGNAPSSPLGSTHEASNVVQTDSLQAAELARPEAPIPEREEVVKETLDESLRASGQIVTETPVGSPASSTAEARPIADSYALEPKDVKAEEEEEAPSSSGVPLIESFTRSETVSQHVEESAPEDMRTAKRSSPAELPKYLRSDADGLLKTLSEFQNHHNPDVVLQMLTAAASGRDTAEQVFCISVPIAAQNEKLDWTIGKLVEVYMALEDRFDSGSPSVFALETEISSVAVAPQNVKRTRQATKNKEEQEGVIRIFCASSARGDAACLVIELLREHKVIPDSKYYKDIFEVLPFSKL